MNVVDKVGLQRRAVVRYERRNFHSYDRDWARGVDVIRGEQIQAESKLPRARRRPFLAQLIEDESELHIVVVRYT